MKKPNKCERCGHEWNYKGNSSNPTCPKCKYKVYNTIKEGETDGQDNTKH